MQTFTGFEYIKIDIANQMGMDKELWETRINWVNEREDCLVDFTGEADNKHLYAKAVRAYEDAKDGIATGFAMGLDATASGQQLMACMSGCPTTAANVNLIHSNSREDIYLKISNHMNKVHGTNTKRGDVKDPIMTSAYGSKAEPKKVFGDGTPELAAFYDALQVEVPGAVSVLNDVSAFIDSNRSNYEWYMPDGHYVNCKVMVKEDVKIEIQELGGTTFTHRAKVNKPNPRDVSLIANVTHAVDGYVVREMIRRCDHDLFTIHDSFWASPNNMNSVRQNYLEILREIASQDLLGNILSQISNSNINIIKTDPLLHLKMINANYHLS